jgi:hypothetical protein
MVGFLSEIAPKNLTAIGFRQLLASVYSDVDRFGDARVLLAQDMATDFGEVPLDDGWLTIMLCCATTAAALNDYDASRVLYERLLPYERRIAAVYATVSGAVARHLGRLASVLRRDIDAESHFRIALELHEQIRAPYWTACTHLDICDLLVRRQSPGDVPRARELADRARLTAQERGYLGLLARSSTVDV